MLHHSSRLWRESKNLQIFIEPSLPLNAPLSLYLQEFFLSLSLQLCACPRACNECMALGEVTKREKSLQIKREGNIQGEGGLDKNLFYLSFLFSYCIQSDVTSQRLSLSVGLKKTDPDYSYLCCSLGLFAFRSSLMSGGRTSGRCSSITSPQQHSWDFRGKILDLVFWVFFGRCDFSLNRQIIVFM